MKQIQYWETKELNQETETRLTQNEELTYLTIVKYRIYICESLYLLNYGRRQSPHSMRLRYAECSKILFTEQITNETVLRIMNIITDKQQRQDIWSTFTE